MLPRTLTLRIKAALRDMPVVLLTGARQVGKSTLAQTLVAEERYFTLDDATVLAAVQGDPSALLERHDGTIVIDEVQRVPELLLAIKASVDRRRRPGRFLLTGAAAIRFVRRVAASLVGRMETLNLWRLSQGEAGEHRETFLDAIRRNRLPGDPSAAGVEAGAGRLGRRGYPAGDDWTGRRRGAWA